MAWQEWTHSGRRLRFVGGGLGKGVALDLRSGPYLFLEPEPMRVAIGRNSTAQYTIAQGEDPVLPSREAHAGRMGM